MPTATDKALTADDVSRIMRFPDPALHGRAARLERGADSLGPHHCKLSSCIADGFVLILCNGLRCQGFER